MKHAREDYNRIQDPAGIIPMDEPVFLVRGQDAAGPETLRAWAREAETQGSGPEIIAKALAQAEAMEDWQRERNWKAADL